MSSTNTASTVDIVLRHAVYSAVSVGSLDRMPDDRATPPRWRERLIPKTTLGISLIVLAAGLGCAFSGAALYAYYDYRLNKNEDRTEAYVRGFDTRFKRAQDIIAFETATAQGQIRDQLKPLEQITAAGGTLDQILQKVSPSLWFVHTLDENGVASVGTGFVVASDDQNAFLVTSYNTIRAATRTPGPDVMVRHGDEDIKATLWTWQEERDLALLLVAKPGAPRIPWADGNPPIRTGERTFAVSGLGGAGGAITQGLVADISAPTVQHTAAVGVQFQGGPLVNSNGEVVAIASRVYAPLGFTSDQVAFAVPIRMACERVLKCPSGGPASPGDRR
jgi:S1-C subfamily serine protease